VRSNERLIREFYEARARSDWAAASGMLAQDVVWHEDQQQDYSGDHHGRDHVIKLLARLVEITQGTFQLEPVAILTTAEHVAAHVRWRAERDGRSVDGNDLAVYRIAGGKIVEAWFFSDGFDPVALGAVFSFDA
jgi:ketosteroid isomerase-like protein